MRLCPSYTFHAWAQGGVAASHPASAGFVALNWLWCCHLCCVCWWSVSFVRFWPPWQGERSSAMIVRRAVCRALASSSVLAHLLPQRRSASISTHRLSHALVQAASCAFILYSFLPQVLLMRRAACSAVVAFTLGRTPLPPRAPERRPCLVGAQRRRLSAVHDCGAVSQQLCSSCSGRTVESTLRCFFYILPTLRRPQWFHMGAEALRL